jgi:hypothetical protein
MKETFILACLMILSLVGQAQSSKLKKPFGITAVELEFDTITAEFIPSQARTIVPYLKLLTNEDSWGMEEGSQLYYRKHDSIWLEVSIPFGNVKMDTVDLNGVGRPELILTCENCIGGSGGRSCEGSSIIINIEKYPVQLLKIKTYCMQEIYHRTYGDDTVAVEGCYAEYRREVTIEDRLVVIHPNDLESLKEFQEHCGEPCELTQVPSGLYELKSGNLTRTKRQPEDLR